jgi:hypothetical protein
VCHNPYVNREDFAVFKKCIFGIIALSLLPMADAVAAKKEKKPAGGVNCQEQANASCPGYGMSRQACYRAAMARCRGGR